MCADKFRRIVFIKNLVERLPWWENYQQHSQENNQTDFSSSNVKASSNILISRRFNWNAWIRSTFGQFPGICTESAAMDVRWRLHCMQTLIKNQQTRLTRISSPDLWCASLSSWKCWKFSTTGPAYCPRHKSNSTSSKHAASPWAYWAQCWL